MGWVLIVVGAVLALGGAAGTFLIGMHVVKSFPDEDDARRNEARYVRPAGRLAATSVGGMLLILIGGIALLVDALT